MSLLRVIFSQCWESYNIEMQTEHTVQINLTTMDAAGLFNYVLEWKWKQLLLGIILYNCKHYTDCVRKYNIEQNADILLWKCKLFYQMSFN